VPFTAYSVITISKSHNVKSSYAQNRLFANNSGKP